MDRWHACICYERFVLTCQGQNKTKQDGWFTMCSRADVALPARFDFLNVGRLVSQIRHHNALMTTRWFSVFTAGAQRRRSGSFLRGWHSCCRECKWQVLDGSVNYLCSQCVGASLVFTGLPSCTLSTRGQSDTYVNLYTYNFYAVVVARTLTQLCRPVTHIKSS